MSTNIIGIGMDATEIDRIEATIARYGDRFLHRIFTEGEIAYATRRRNPAPHFAGRFAAKEAAMKALGTGHSQGVLWRDIEVVRARRAAATAVSRRRGPAIRPPEGKQLAVDDYALANARHRAGDAAPLVVIVRGAIADARAQRHSVVPP